MNPTEPQFIPYTGVLNPCASSRCSVSNMNPSPPSATITSASARPQVPRAPTKRSSDCRARSVGAATNAIRVGATGKYAGVAATSSSIAPA